MFTLRTGELPLARVAELRAGELTAELPPILELIAILELARLELALVELPLVELPLTELARLSELDVSLVVELSVELLL